jgi:diguanylate cyclase (GGDEF)-like protein/hemerythrin-like metal-binding protein
MIAGQGENMESFQWGQHFLTEIEDIDQQHRSLVAMINSFGEAVTADTADFDFLMEIYGQLADYARRHFKTEEQLMKSMRLDSRHIQYHVKQHRDFVDEIGNFKKTINPENPENYHPLFEYLVNWLAYHILVCDKNMARQILAVENGESAEQVFLQEEKQADSAMQPLVRALNGLFTLVSERNKALAELNRTLELRVAERTGELVRANEALEIISITDHLTQLANRRFAMRQLGLLWAEMEVTGQPLSVLMIDADGFKAVNDRYGHDAGDVVLQRLAVELKDSVRSDDIVCRLGGDEFIIICPDTDLEGAVFLGELTLSAVTALKVAVGSGFWSGSVSIGVACSSHDMKDVNALLKAADDAVYAAKKNGRKCVMPMDFAEV